jgi:pyrroline-5-carboxylate reductase
VAVPKSDVIIVCVVPHSLNELLDEIRPMLKPNQVLISCVSGAEIADIQERLNKSSVELARCNIEVVRAMPNTAIALGESMTCIAGTTKSSPGVKLTKEIFDNLGVAMIVVEQQIVPATALCACGIAFFARAIRAAGQGGIQVSEEGK